MVDTENPPGIVFNVDRNEPLVRPSFSVPDVSSGGDTSKTRYGKNFQKLLAEFPQHPSDFREAVLWILDPDMSLKQDPHRPIDDQLQLTPADATRKAQAAFFIGLDLGRAHTFACPVDTSENIGHLADVYAGVMNRHNKGQEVYPDKSFFNNNTILRETVLSDNKTVEQRLQELNPSISLEDLPQYMRECLNSFQNPSLSEKDKAEIIRELMEYGLRMGAELGHKYSVTLTDDISSIGLKMMFDLYKARHKENMSPQAPSFVPNMDAHMQPHPDIRAGAPVVWTAIPAKQGQEAGRHGEQVRPHPEAVNQLQEQEAHDEAIRLLPDFRQYAISMYHGKPSARLGGNAGAFRSVLAYYHGQQHPELNRNGIDMTLGELLPVHLYPDELPSLGAPGTTLTDASTILFEDLGFANPQVIDIRSQDNRMELVDQIVIPENSFVVFSLTMNESFGRRPQGQWLFALPVEQAKLVRKAYQNRYFPFEFFKTVITNMQRTDPADRSNIVIGTDYYATEEVKEEYGVKSVSIWPSTRLSEAVHGGQEDFSIYHPTHIKYKVKGKVQEAQKIYNLIYPEAAHPH